MGDNIVINMQADHQGTLGLVWEYQEIKCEKVVQKGCTTFQQRSRSTKLRA